MRIPAPEKKSFWFNLTQCFLGMWQNTQFEGIAIKQNWAKALWDCDNIYQPVMGLFCSSGSYKGNRYECTLPSVLVIVLVCLNSRGRSHTAQEDRVLTRPLQVERARLSVHWAILSLLRHLSCLLHRASPETLQLRKSRQYHHIQLYVFHLYIVQ